jgi:signal peptidase I
VPERLINHEDFGALAEEVVRKGGFFHFQAHGNSMRPFISSGETIELSGVEPVHIRHGEIILCWLAKDVLLLHRVVQVQDTPVGRKFLVQGDASCSPDGWVPEENVLGRATAVLRKGKWAALDAFPVSYLGRFWITAIPLRRIAARLAGVFKR